METQVETAELPIVLRGPDAAERELSPLAASQPLLSGQVRSVSGAPIANARVAWIALRHPDIEETPSWPISMWAEFDRPRVVGTTSSDGAFAFADAPSTDLPFGSVVTVASHGYVAGGADVGTARILDLVLEPAESISVLVHDSEGKPRPGALIRHLSRPTTHGWLVPKYQRFFAQELHSDGSGRAELPPFPGEQRIWAEHEGLVSAPFEGRRPSQVILRLGEAFTVGGLARFPDRNSWDPLYTGERRIHVLGLVGSSWRPLQSVGNVVDGEWGPITVPLESYSRFRVRLEGVPIVPIEEVFDAPRPSSHRRVDFVAEKAMDLWLAVQDESESPVTTAKAIAWWAPVPTPHPVGGSYVEGESRQDGYIYLGSFPAGNVQYRVTAPGFGSSEGLTVVPTDAASLVTLKPGSRLRGRCLHQGKPVPDFELIYWKNVNPVLPQREAFFDREDGRFELESLPVGDWSFHARTATLPAGRPVTVQLVAHEEGEIEIEIPAALRGGGVVLDGENGEPISGARVQSVSSSGLTPSFEFGAPVLTGASGEFDMDAFVRGTNYLRIEADGYAPTRVEKLVTADDLVDWGEIRMARPQSLEIALLGLEESGLQPESISVHTTEGHVLPSTPFDADGVVHFEGVPPGDHKPFVLFADGSFARIHLRVEIGKEARFDLKISGERRVRLRVVDAQGEPLEQEPIVLIACQEDTGQFVLRQRIASKDGVAGFEGIRGDRVHAMVRNWDNDIIAERHFSFDGSAPLDEVIQVGGTPLVVRVVDADGEPLVGARLTARSVEGEQILAAAGSGADGSSKLLGVPEKPILLDVRHGTAGRRYGIPLDGSVREHEIVLDARGSLELRVLDGEEPLASIAARIETTGGVTLGEAQQTGADGRVRFEPLGEGSYHIGLRRGDCWPAAVDRGLGAEEHASLDVQVRRLADLELSVRSPEGLPVSGLALELTSSEFGAAVADWVREERVRAPDGLATSVRGVVRVEGLPRGTYSWSAEVGGETLRGSFELEPAKLNEIAVIVGE